MVWTAPVTAFHPNRSRLTSTLCGHHLVRSLMQGFAWLSWSPDANQNAIRTTYRELIHTPWLAMSSASLDDDVADLISNRIDVIAVQINPMRVAIRNDPAFAAQ